jgi:hypothetical protein
MAVKVGWVQLQEDPRLSNMGGVAMSPYMMFDPERYKRISEVKHGRWRFTTCPAFIQFNRNTFVLRSPVDMGLSVREGNNPGLWDMRVLPGHENDLNGEALHRLIEFTGDPGGRVDWDKPHLQMRLMYVFFADEPITIQQLPAFEDYNEDSSYPGITVPGEFDIHAWHRQLNWAFEWWDTSKPLIVKRGDPLTYAKFIVHRDPTERVDLVKLKMTDQIYNAIHRTNNTPSFIKNTFKLFEKARLMRPKKFITEANIWKPGD